MRQVIELICKHPKMRRILPRESPDFLHWFIRGYKSVDELARATAEL